MQTLVCTMPGHFEYQDAEVPHLTKGDALVKINRIGICGTDLHAFEGTQPYFSYPRILGHELGGELVDFDDAPGFSKGEAVTFIPYVNDGSCIACRMGKPNCCQHMSVLGVHADGGMAEYVKVPSRLLVHGEGLGSDALALVEPLAIGAHGISRANVQPNEFVLVIGAGPIGLGIMEFARIAGAQVIAMDINEHRLSFCRERLGVNYTINAATQQAETVLQEITNNDFPTVVIDATGNLNAINKGFDYIAHGGRYVLVGLQKGDIVVNHPNFHKREATLMSSRNATRADFEQVIRCIKQGRVNPTNYITHRVTFSQVKNNFKDWLDPKNGVIKAMVSL